MEQIRDNAVSIIGTTKGELRKIDNIYGQQYKGYAVEILSERKSGVLDEVVAICPQETEQLAAGTPVICYGKLQTFKNYKSGRVLVYVLAELFTATGEHYEPENEVRLKGTLGKGITHRETPSGKHITDIKVITPNVLREGGSCYVPAICWNRAADEVKDWQEGTQVELAGRLQSRCYEKPDENGEPIFYTCREVSIYKITKSEG